MIAAASGTGKTALALWLARKTQKLGLTWVFVSLPSVQKPYAPNGLANHVQQTLGIERQEMAAPRRRHLVLMLDSLDEVPREHVALLSWFQLNGFEAWDVRLIVTCRQEHIHDDPHDPHGIAEVPSIRFGEGMAAQGHARIEHTLEAVVAGI